MPRRFIILFVAVLLVASGAIALGYYLLFPQAPSGMPPDMHQAALQGRMHSEAGNYEMSAAAYETAVAIGERQLGYGHPRTVKMLENLAIQHRRLGRHREAEKLIERALASYRSRYGPSHPSVASAYQRLGEIRFLTGQTDEALHYFEQALAIREAALGNAHPAVAATYNVLALAHGQIGRYAKAEKYFRSAITIMELRPDGPHQLLIVLHGNLSELLLAQGRYDEAEQEARWAVELAEEIRGQSHPDVAFALNNLAVILNEQGRFNEAQNIQTRVLAIYEIIFPSNHPKIITSLNNLASGFQAKGRASEALPLLERALQLSETAMGQTNPQLAPLVNNLGAAFEALGRSDDARSHYMRALGILEKSYGPHHPDIARTLISLGLFEHRADRSDIAEHHLQRALLISESASGRKSHLVASILNSLGKIYGDQGRFKEAVSLFSEALAIGKELYGPEDPRVGSTLHSISHAHFALYNRDLALTFSRQASKVFLKRLLSAGDGQYENKDDERRSLKGIFLLHVNATYEMAIEDPSNRGELIREAFEISQLANVTSASTALSRMAARFAAGNDTLAELVRERQDELDNWKKTDSKLIGALSRPIAQRNIDDEESLRELRAVAQRRLNQLDARLASNFPRYAEFSLPTPISADDIDALLDTKEALITYSVGQSATFAFVVYRGVTTMTKLEISKHDLRDAVANLRQALNLSGVRSTADLRRFNTANAYNLYETLIAPLESHIEDARHLTIVTDGPLQSLPFSVLLTNEPETPTDALSDYRDLAWLSRQFSISVLPSVSSLRVLRVFARDAGAEKPFLGIGDPSLEGDPGTNRGAPISSLFTARGLGNVRSIRNLAALPETAQELRVLARALNATDEDLRLRDAATESWVRSATLSDYRVVAFATHGLVSGELFGLAEPALVLTPPEKASEQDDGLLTASEVARLKLDADWIILSACNTAAGDGTPGADGLSGLAQSFFYAGSRALLVSHWPVSSDAALKITTRMLEEATTGKISRAEAHRRAMMSLLDPDQPDHFAHPAFWAPFFIVGESRAIHR